MSGWLPFRDVMISAMELDVSVEDDVFAREEEVVVAGSEVVQNELDNSRYMLNNHKSRKDRNLTRPTGITPSIALALYNQHGGVNCLQNADSAVVGHLMEDVGGEDVVRFVSKAYERRALAVLEALGVREVKLGNSCSEDYDDTGMELHSLLSA